MHEDLGYDKKEPLGMAWLALPFVIFALVSLTVGMLAARTVQQPYGAPYFSLFFSDALHLKAWLTSAALTLGCLQVLTSARIYNVLRFPPQGRFYNVVHRFSGWTAIALTVPVGYHCVFLLGFGGTLPCAAPSTCVLVFGRIYDLRILAHSLLGASMYGTFLAKVLLVRSHRYPGWALPVAGGLLFATLLGLWLTSAFWFFQTYGIGI